jgi:hypothetical protein
LNLRFIKFKYRIIIFQDIWIWGKQDHANIHLFCFLLQHHTELYALPVFIDFGNLDLDMLV